MFGVIYDEQLQIWRVLLNQLCKSKSIIYVLQTSIVFLSEIEVNKSTKQGSENVMANTDCYICLENRTEDKAPTEFYVFGECCHALYLCVACADKLVICPWRCKGQDAQQKKRLIIMSN